MKKTKFLFSIFIAFIISFAIYSGSRIEAKAEELQYQNVLTGQNFTYSGKIVSFQINGVAVPDTYPGLIASDGSAIGSCKELFVDRADVVFRWITQDKTFELSYGTKKIRMTLDSQAAYINDSYFYLPTAPKYLKMSSKSEKRIYVPTRFVSETFGFSYVWNPTKSLSSITKPDKVFQEETQNETNAILVKFVRKSVEEEVFSEKGFYIEDEAFFPLNVCIDKAGIGKSKFYEESGVIVIKTESHSLRMVLESPVAYFDETPFLLTAVPRFLTDAFEKTSEIYIPFLAVAKALSEEVLFKKDEPSVILYKNGDFSNSDKLSQEKPEDISNQEKNEYFPDSSLFTSELFSLKITEDEKEEWKQKGEKVAELMTAYSCEHSDAVFLKGIYLSDITLSDKGDEIELIANRVSNSFEPKAYFYPENRFLNYYFIFGTDLRIKFIKFSNIRSYAYDVPEGCIIHFTDTIEIVEDKITFIKKIPETTDTDILSEPEESPEIPEIIFSRDTLVIPVNNEIKKVSLSDIDEYQNNQFRIIFPGNLVSYLHQQDVYNRNPMIKQISYTYNSENNSTSILVTTSKIQGYTYGVTDGFLYIRVADPEKIYKKIIVLDAGHGGIDPGTQRNGVLEKTINYNVINKYAADLFQSSDIKVYLTRTDDTKVSLSERASFAKEVGADFFISFHVNANTSSLVAGTNVYYSSSNNNITASGLSSSVLAQTMQTFMVNEWGTRDRGILTAKFDVIHKNTVPAVLIECAFITNDNDFKKIKDTDYQKKAAKAIYDGVKMIYAKYSFR